MALPKIHRLRRRRDFNTVYQAGLRRSTTHLVLRGLRTPSPLVRKPDRFSIAPSANVVKPPTQVGISISQKVSKRAVIRNRIRRLIRAGLRDLLPQMASGWRLVIVVQPSAIECDYWQFLQELKQLLVEAEVIHGYSRGDDL